MDQVLLGSILGDGTLRIPTPRCRNARFTESHSTKQREYLEWKMRCLSRFNPRSFEYQVNDGTGHFHPVIQMYTSVSPELTQYYREFYPHGKKILGPALDRLEPLGLAVWYGDDGNFYYGTRELTLATNGYTEAENEQIRIWFTEHGMPTAIKYNRGKPYQRFLADGRDKLLSIITDYVHPSLIEKLGLNEQRNERRKEITRERWRRRHGYASRQRTEN